jgi:molybdopterin synthase catalytic subunit
VTTVLISADPIAPDWPRFLPEEGAEVRFLGVVRGSEDGLPIAGIDYTAYLPMAQRLLEQLAQQGQADHGPHRLFIHHRLGFVGNEQASVVIAVCTKHSAAAFELCRWYLAELKTRVPIWKQVVRRSGSGPDGLPHAQ